LRKFKSQIAVQGINVVTKTIHYAASLEINPDLATGKLK
jgi:hypothetical protein